MARSDAPVSADGVDFSLTCLDANLRHRDLLLGLEGRDITVRVERSEAWVTIKKHRVLKGRYKSIPQIFFAIRNLSSLQHCCSLQDC